MDTRYCVELDLEEMMITVHRQSCITYPHSWVRLSRVVDLGSFEDCDAALSQAKKDYPSPWYCAQCLCLRRRGLRGVLPAESKIYSPLVN